MLTKYYTTKVSTKLAGPQGASPAALKAWHRGELFWFRVAFIFFGIMGIPTDYGYYVMLANFDWWHLNYRHLTEMAAFFNPQFLNIYSESGFFGIASYINWPLILLVALLGALIWTLLDRRRSYNNLYYLLRVLLRYRVACAGMAWGFKKIFIMQMPAQFEGIWNTPLNQFFAKRLYWEVLSVAPSYEVYLGCAEFMAGFLLLFRRTTAVGAALAFVVFGNIAVSNHAYDIGEQVPSALMALMALFLLVKELPPLYQLIIKEKSVRPVTYYPVLRQPWQIWTRRILKAGFSFFFVLLFAYFEVRGVVQNDFYKIPNTPGLKNIQGVYHPVVFKLNGITHPYDPLDTLRWRDVIFEKWSSMGVGYVHRPQQIAAFAAGSYPRVGEPYDNQLYFNWKGDLRRYHLDGEGRSHPKGKWPRDIKISWEFSGIQGRVYYYYEADTVHKVLRLINKNQYHRDEKLVLEYERPDNKTVILTGFNEYMDTVYVELKKNPKISIRY